MDGGAVVTAPTDLVAYQIGFLKGRGYSDSDIDRFAALMDTQPTVRPLPRLVCAADQTDDHPTENSTT